MSDLAARSQLDAGRTPGVAGIFNENSSANQGILYGGKIEA